MINALTTYGLQDQSSVVRLCYDAISSASSTDILFDASTLTYRVGTVAMSADNPARNGTAIPQTVVLFGRIVAAFDFDQKPWPAADEVPNSQRRAIPYLEEIQALEEPDLTVGKRKGLCWVKRLKRVFNGAAQV